MTKLLLVVTIIVLLFAFIAAVFLTARYIDKLRDCDYDEEAKEIRCSWVWEDL